MATSRIAVQAQDFIGTPDGETNTYVRKQIQRLRLSKGWTKHDLEKAAGMAADTLEDFEAGIRRFNVDTLRKIIEALEADITEVWPSAEGVPRLRNSFRPEQIGDPLHFSRLAELHALTGAEASCMFMGDNHPGPGQATGEKAGGGPLRTLSAINLNRQDRALLCIKVLHGTAASPWVTYVHRANSCSLYLCLKNARIESGTEILIQRCLSAWLAASAQ